MWGDTTALYAEFDSLLQLIDVNPDLFSEEQKDIVLKARNSTQTPRARLQRHRARSRSRSRPGASSLTRPLSLSSSSEASFLSTSSKSSVMSESSGAVSKNKDVVDGSVGAKDDAKDSADAISKGDDQLFDVQRKMLELEFKIKAERREREEERRRAEFQREREDQEKELEWAQMQLNLHQLKYQATGFTPLNDPDVHLMSNLLSDKLTLSGSTDSPSPGVTSTAPLSSTGATSTASPSLGATSSASPSPGVTSKTSSSPGVPSASTGSISSASPLAGAASAATSTTSGGNDRLFELVGSQRIKDSTPREADRYGGSAADYAKFELKFKSEVLDVGGISDEQKFLALQDRTKGEAKEIVENHVYNVDKAEALVKAMADLKFNWGSRVGIAQNNLSSLISGREVHPDSTESVQKLMWDVQKFASQARASGEADILALETTVHLITEKRFGRNMKQRFSRSAQKAKDDGKKVNVDMLIAFLKEWFQSLNHSFGMGSYSHAKSNLPTTSSSSSSPSSTHLSQSSKPRTNVAAVNAFGGNRGRGNRFPQRQNSSSWIAAANATPLKCLYCESAHALADCPTFCGRTSYEERFNFVKGLKRCFRCFESHFAHECTANVKCSYCQRPSHHTLLHSFAPIESRRAGQTQVAAASVSAAPRTPTLLPTPQLNRLMEMANGTGASQDGVLDQVGQAARQANVSAIDCKVVGFCYRPIVAIRVIYDDGRFVDVYGLIDTGSNKTVVTKAFKDRSRLKFRKEWVTLTALGTTTSGFRDTSSLSLQSLVNQDYLLKNVEVYVVDSLPVDASQIARQCHVSQYAHLDNVNLVELPIHHVDILIGTDLTPSIIPLQIKWGNFSTPSALLYKWGWALCGQAGSVSDKSGWSAFLSLGPGEAQRLEDKLEKMYRHDFPDLPSQRLGQSRDERRAKEMLDETCKFKNGRFESGLLLKHDRAKTAEILPTAESEKTARVRTFKLAKKLSARPELKAVVEAQIQDLLEKGFAEKVTDMTVSSDLTWYLPSLVVEHERKDKPRFCLDGKAESAGVSLNSVLLPGEGAMTTVFAAIQNARRFEFFCSSDIQAYYHMIEVAPQDRDLLRFFWWTAEGRLECLRMCVNIFGSVCSYSIASHAFVKNAELHGEKYPEGVIEAVKGAYVDDIPFSEPTEDELVVVGKGLVDLCGEGGFTLTKFASNSRKLLASIPEDQRAVGFKDPDGKLPRISVLGMWNDPETDFLHVKIPVKKGGGTISTRTEVLSAVMGIFDPIGIISPYVLIGKKLNQRLNTAKVKWDDPLSPEFAAEVNEWYAEVSKLDKLSIPRSLKLVSRLTEVTLHTFSDASNIGYGCCCYFVVDGTFDVYFITSRSRVSPDKGVLVDVNGSTPKGELQSSVTGTETATQIEEEIDVVISRKVFHTDSTCVYFWLHNKEQKYKVFVANRINKILLVSSPQDWHHVPTDLNPADVVSRGALPDDAAAWKLFHEGPPFLRGPEQDWPPLPPRQTGAMVGAMELEVDKVKVPSQSLSFVETLLRKKSNFISAKHVLVYVSRFISACKEKRRTNGLTGNSVSPPSISDLQAAETRMILDVQRRAFGAEVDALLGASQAPRQVKKMLTKSSSAVRDLNPFLDDQGMLRVGGRLRNSDEPWEVKHPIILPQSDPFTNHVIVEVHIELAHGGVEFVLAESRRRFWILRGRQNIKKVIWRCFTCRRQFRQPEQQQMASLPSSRLTIAHPFRDSAVDLLGPFLVKSGKRGMKVWIVLFTCLRVRAVYLDLVKNINKEAFIEALQRFHSFNPGVKSLISDQGTNLTGAHNILSAMMKEWEGGARDWMTPRGIEWHFIPPHAPHQGGVWERLVGVVKKVLQTLVHPEMQFEKFRTLVILAAGIVNRRPLTRSSMDSSDTSALTPMHFICPNTVITPSSDTLPAAPFAGSALRRSHDTLRPLVDSFWKQWRSQYVACLQRRSKWICRQRNLQPGDLVLMVEENHPRETWPLGLVKSVTVDDEGNCRNVLLINSVKREVERDVRKVVLLEREGEGESVEEEVVQMPQNMVGARK